MKKVAFAFLACFCFVAVASAEEDQSTVATPQPQPFTRVETRETVPVHLAIGVDENDRYIDIIGLRMSIWGKCHDLTGVDLSIGAEAQNMYGLQVSLLRNKVNDRAGAFQLALFSNSAPYMTGVQLSAVNTSVVAKGLQLGLVNASSDVRGFQIGLVNSTDIIYGYQIGLINVIKGSAVPFFPIVNFQFTED